MVKPINNEDGMRIGYEEYNQSANKRYLVFEIEFGDIMNVTIVYADDKEEAGKKAADIFELEKPVPQLNIHEIDTLPNGWTKINNKEE